MFCLSDPGAAGNLTGIAATLILGLGTVLTLPVAVKLYRVSKTLLDLGEKRKASESLPPDKELENVSPDELKKVLAKLKQNDDALGELLKDQQESLEVRQGASWKLNAGLFVIGFLLALASDAIPLWVNKCRPAATGQESTGATIDGAASAASPLPRQ